MTVATPSSQTRRRLISALNDQRFGNSQQPALGLETGCDRQLRNPDDPAHQLDAGERAYQRQIGWIAVLRHHCCRRRLALPCQQQMSGHDPEVELRRSDKRKIGIDHTNTSGTAQPAPGKVVAVHERTAGRQIKIPKGVDTRDVAPVFLQSSRERAERIVPIRWRITVVFDESTTPIQVNWEVVDDGEVAVAGVEPLEPFCGYLEALAVGLGRCREFDVQERLW